MTTKTLPDVWRKVLDNVPCDWTPCAAIVVDGVHPATVLPILYGLQRRGLVEIQMEPRCFAVTRCRRVPETEPSPLESPTLLLDCYLLRAFGNLLAAKTEARRLDDQNAGCAVEVAITAIQPLIKPELLKVPGVVS